MARTFLFFSIALCGLCVGCAPPVMSINYKLPADIAIPLDSRAVEVQEFSVASGPEDTHGKFVADLLSRRLAYSGHYEVVCECREPQGSSAQIVITGSLRIQTQDTESVRRIRVFDPEAQRLEEVEVPSLVREAAVRVDFVVKEAQSGEALGTVETREAYNSLNDPRVRGDLGLERPDDPDYVPSAETVVRELLTRCVERFCAIIRPIEISGRVRLRPTLSPNGQKGLAAARRGQFQEAVLHFTAAVEPQPGNPDSLFNLAASEECAGLLKEALAHYEAALERSNGRDEQAREAVRRLRRILGYR